jgi:acetyltransferase-like isoleucine patch superfamily enzyme
MKITLKNLVIKIAVIFFQFANMIGQLGWLITLHSLFRQAFWKAKLKSMGKNVIILPKVIIRFPEMVELGNNVAIGEFVHIWGLGGVTIGEDSLVAAHTSIISQTHDLNAQLYRVSHILKPVVIGCNVWIGSGVAILPGVTIGNGAVIGAGSVLTRNVPSGEVWAGNPARFIKMI